MSVERSAWPYRVLSRCRRFIGRPADRNSHFCPPLVGRHLLRNSDTRDRTVDKWYHTIHITYMGRGRRAKYRRKRQRMERRLRLAS